jgi:hypothetical protein
MARKANGGDGSKAVKAPAKAPARRRTAKPAVQTPVAAANDNGGSNGSSEKTTHSRTVDPSEVERLAYELYLQRGGNHGQDRDDWFEAERQLRKASQA